MDVMQRRAQVKAAADDVTSARLALDRAIVALGLVPGTLDLRLDLAVEHQHLGNINSRIKVTRVT